MALLHCSFRSYMLKLRLSWESAGHFRRNGRTFRIPRRSTTLAYRNGEEVASLPPFCGSHGCFREPSCLQFAHEFGREKLNLNGISEITYGES